MSKRRPTVHSMLAYVVSKMFKSWGLMTLARSRFLKLWVLSMVTIGTWEHIHLQRRIDRSHSIVGASEDEVLNALGEPRAKWGPRRGLALIVGRRPAVWIYGTTIDLDFIIGPDFYIPNPIPINLRLFGHGDEDLVVEWTPERTVSAVRRPDLTFPRGFEVLFEPLFFLADLIWLFRRRK